MADNKDEIIYCPACGQEMKKVNVGNPEISLDVCLDGCGGIYFDNNELKKFDESFEDIHELEKAFENKTFKKVDETEKRKCPICNWDMVKNFSGSTHSVQVDECYGCGGKFLDYSELEKIRKEYTTDEERSKAAIQEMYIKSGTELYEFEAKYQNQIKEGRSLLGRLIRFMYNK